MNKFLHSFAKAARIPFSIADEQWAGFSRNMTDNEREQTEAGGEDSGRQMGQEFLKLYGDDDLDR